ncbi:replication initiator protein [Dipodfec virus UOA04_Rod_718]|nr:replication initiator protein [Dipodfec virus UOA04_Rod_718]
MCFFPLPNPKVDGPAYQKGISHFDCGACPECLHKRSNVWALRCSYEAAQHLDNCMITLTYDNYARDASGKIIGELPPDRDLKVNKRDVQLFIKRLRKYFGNQHIKYLITAEYGSRTHRAHYHAILFGVRFPDLVLYKKSKRNNMIYKSAVLTHLWHHGICTVDSISVNSSVARYCTKYCAKTRSENTFMLFSQHIGEIGLMNDFNGKYYVSDGKYFPIPRFIWEKVIFNRYCSLYDNFDYHYLNRTPETEASGEFAANVLQRKLYRAIRDSDPQYTAYLAYWRERATQFEALKLPVEQRIFLLPDEKYAHYKALCKDYFLWRAKGIPVPPPQSNCKSNYHHWLHYVNLDCDLRTCRSSSCLYTASDTKKRKTEIYITDNIVLSPHKRLIPLPFIQKLKL